MRLGDLIDPFQRADRPPPRTLAAFFAWALTDGAMPVLSIAAVLSALAGTLEVITALLLGAVIDSALASGPNPFYFGENVLLLSAFIVFFLFLRPVIFGISGCRQRHRCRTERDAAGAVAAASLDNGTVGDVLRR